MSLLEQIRNSFADKSKVATFKITGLPDEYPAWAIRQGETFGVCIPYNGEAVNEEFANVIMRSMDNIKLDNDYDEYLVLISNLEKAREEFAMICENFIDAGADNLNRIELIANPLTWWRRWQSLIGNAVVNKRPYSVIGELAVVYYLCKKGENPIWNGPKSASSDISTPSESVEVKSTVKRYEKIIHAAGQYQFDKDNLSLYFCRLEEDEHGISINALVEKLVLNGFDLNLLNKNLKKLGYAVGSSARKLKYQIHEISKYNVDENFPKIVDASFAGGTIPVGIQHISYEIDLTALPCLNIDLDFLKQ